jgi:predicted glycoside hydrolase/deacetylase ChbG (UPF0249 family)
MRDVIVNVDDLGLHPAVTRAVQLLSSLGTVNSASVLANGPYVSDALSLCGQVYLGAHLNILRGKPLSPISKVPTLVNSQGYFFGDYSTLFLKCILGQVSLAEVELEWRAQIEMLISMGISIAHLDSEKHTHVWPMLTPLICRLAEEYHIPRVRYPYELQKGLPSHFGYVRAAILRYLSQKMTLNCPKEKYFPFSWGLVDQSERLSPQVFLAYLQSLPDASPVEIICHPGVPLPDDEPIGHEFGQLRVYTMWQPEFDLLASKAWQEVFSCVYVRLKAVE